MSDSHAKRLIGLNLQAIAIDRLGIQLDFGFEKSNQTELERINSELVTQLAQDVELDAESPTVGEWLRGYTFPDRYRAIAEMLLLADDPRPILDSIAVRSVERTLLSKPLRRAAIEPFAIAGLVYLGTLFLCLFMIPKLEADHAQRGIEPEGATKFLLLIRDMMPVWSILVPVTLLLIYWVGKRWLPSLLQYLPGSGRYVHWLALETKSKQLSTLVHAGLKSDQAMALAGAAQAKSQANSQDSPLLRVLSEDDSQPRRENTLNQLTRFYRFLAIEYRQSVLANIPAWISLFVTGSLVLGYALFTFLPWMETLRGLGQVGEGMR